MPYRRFVAFNILGALVWAVGLTALGYFLGNSIPDIENYLMPVLAIIIVVSLLPSIVHILKDAEQRTKIWHFITRRKS